jgi:hypothetical protein
MIGVDEFLGDDLHRSFGSENMNDLGEDGPTLTSRRIAIQT